MFKWPKSWWEQAWIAFAIAGVSAYLVFERTEKALFAQYAREAPYDGQDGLSAFMGALHVGAITLVLVFLAVFLLQRAIVPRSQSGSE